MITIDYVRRRAESDARTYGYYLNPDLEFLKGLLEGLRDNEERYGYPSCPCRVASGKFDLDRDIVCPCDYRDPDVIEYGYCYCALYVRKDVFEGKTPIVPIPERRPVEKQAAFFEPAAPPQEKIAEVPPAGEGEEARQSQKATLGAPTEKRLEKKLWYCRQCGYVCFRDDPPYICPVCKAKREMFSEVRLEAKG